MSKMVLFFLLCICHIAGDFFLQTEEMAREKKTKIRVYVKHGVLYAVPYVICGFAAYAVYGINNIRNLLLWCILSHAAIDLIKIVLEIILEKWTGKVFRKNVRAGIYLSDQAAHILCLICGVTLYEGMLPDMPEYVSKAILYMLYFLCLQKPANVTFKQLFSRFHADAANKTKTDGQIKEGAGAWIGNLERTLSGILILLGQFSAVGLAMTAKSVARYNEISENPSFAEYYLIGTLYSILYTVALYCLLFRFLTVIP